MLILEWKLPVCLPYSLSCGSLLHLKISIHVDVLLYNLLMERTMWIIPPHVSCEKSFPRCLSIYRNLLWRIFPDLQLLTKYFMLFLGQCLGTSRTDWTRRICSKSSRRCSPVLWGDLPGRLPITKARYAIFFYPDLNLSMYLLLKYFIYLPQAKFGDTCNFHYICQN